MKALLVVDNLGGSVRVGSRCVFRGTSVPVSDNMQGLPAESIFEDGVSDLSRRLEQR